MIASFYKQSRNTNPVGLDGEKDGKYAIFLLFTAYLFIFFGVLYFLFY